MTTQAEKEQALRIYIPLLLATLGLLVGCNSPTGIHAESGADKIHIIGTNPNDMAPTGSTQGYGLMSDD